MTNIKSISLRKRGTLLHVETPNGIVNIRVGISDVQGRDVDSIEVIPSNYIGEAKVMRRGYGNTRLIRCKKARNR